MTVTSPVLKRGRSAITGTAFSYYSPRGSAWVCWRPVERVLGHLPERIRVHLSTTRKRGRGWQSAIVGDAEAFESMKRFRWRAGAKFGDRVWWKVEACSGD